MIVFSFEEDGDEYIPHSMRGSVRLESDEALDQVIEAFIDFLKMVGYTDVAINKAFSGEEENAS